MRELEKGGEGSVIWEVERERVMERVVERERDVEWEREVRKRGEGRIRREK